MNEIYKKIDSLLAGGDFNEAERLIFTTAESLTSAANAMLNTSNYRDALETLRITAEMMRRYYDENIDFDELKLSVSEIYLLLENIPSAIHELTEAIAIMENRLGPVHQSVIDAKEKLNRMKSELRMIEG